MRSGAAAPRPARSLSSSPPIFLTTTRGSRARRDSSARDETPFVAEQAWTTRGRLAGSNPAATYPAGVTPTKGDLPARAITFGTDEWRQEVERYEANSPARIKAEGARREIESGRVKRGWMKCRSEGSADGT